MKSDYSDGGLGDQEETEHGDIRDPAVAGG